MKNLNKIIEYLEQSNIKHSVSYYPKYISIYFNSIQGALKTLSYIYKYMRSFYYKMHATYKNKKEKYKTFESRIFNYGYIIDKYCLCFDYKED